MDRSIDKWTGLLTNGLDQLTNYTKFAPRLEHIHFLGLGANDSRPLCTRQYLIAVTVQPHHAEVGLD